MLGKRRQHRLDARRYGALAHAVHLSGADGKRTARRRRLLQRPSHYNLTREHVSEARIVAAAPQGVT